MTFTPTRNPSEADIRAIVQASKHKAARRICDPATGAVWYWPAEQATHAEGAALLAVQYDRKPGDGDIVTID